MNENEILEGLEKLYADLQIELRYERGDFYGGLFRYRDQQRVILNRDLNSTQKISILARELRGKVDLEKLYLLPVLREVIENASSVE
ncbi:MAG TPA: hypothetical protein VGA99_03070 [bacterium]|jgi:hypothetical protein